MNPSKGKISVVFWLERREKGEKKRGREQGNGKRRGLKEEEREGAKRKKGWRVKGEKLEFVYNSRTHRLCLVQYLCVLVYSTIVTET